MMMMMMIRSSPTHEPSIGSLINELTDESRQLLRHEVQLARVEIGQKVSQLRRGGAHLAIGALVVLVGVCALVAAVCIGLYCLLNNVMGNEIAAWLAPLLVGIVVALVGYGLIQTGLSALKRESLVPRETIDSLRENSEWLKDQFTTQVHRHTGTDLTIR